MVSVGTFKDNIILDLIELEKLDEVEVDIITQVKNGKFDEDIKELEEYASVTDATDSIRTSYKILNTKQPQMEATMPICKINECKISTSVYKPNTQIHEHSFIRFASYREIIEQIKNYLMSFNSSHDNLDDYNAYSVAEWFNDCRMSSLILDGYSIDTLCEGGKLVVSLQHGGSEGLIIEVNHLNPKGNTNVFYSLVSIKYLINEDEVWRIVRALNTAIND